VKVRIGIGTGGSSGSGGELGQLVDAVDELGFDSLWLSEVLTAPVLDPLVGLAWAAAHNPRIKLGTTMLATGRNPVRLAKALASLDALSGGRLLVTLVPGLARPPEREAIGVPPGARAQIIDEVVPLLRRLWAGETVTHHGRVADFTDVKLSPLPAQEPLEVWLGGMAPAALDQCGRLGDGWLPALCTPKEAADGRDLIEAAAAEAGRTISPEHFGISVGFSRTALDASTVAGLQRRSRGHDPAELVPVGLPATRELLERYIEAGFSKFVLRPLVAPDDWRAELEPLASAVGDLQTL
jgi:probable F420-dependent oxidoreductase